MACLAVLLMTAYGMSNALFLFESDDGSITCFSMAKRIDKSMTSNPQMRSIITKIRQVIDSKGDYTPKGIENHSNNPKAPAFVPWGPEARFGPYAEKRKKKQPRK